jgi:hypothetical protein
LVWAAPARSPVDCLDAQTPESVRVIQRAFERFRCMPLPVQNFFRHPQRVPRPTRPRPMKQSGRRNWPFFLHHRLSDGPEPGNLPDSGRPLYHGRKARGPSLRQISVYPSLIPAPAHETGCSDCPHPEYRGIHHAAALRGLLAIRRFLPYLLSGIRPLEAPPLPSGAKSSISRPGGMRNASLKCPGRMVSTNGKQKCLQSRTGSLSRTRSRSKAQKRCVRRITAQPCVKRCAAARHEWLESVLYGLPPTAAPESRRPLREQEGMRAQMLPGVQLKRVKIQVSCRSRSFLSFCFFRGCAPRGPYPYGSLPIPPGTGRLKGTFRRYREV